jgi:3-oxoacyl-[acyl-carrier-protein] synthase-3
VQVLDKVNRFDQVDWFIPHSANLRMIEPICERQLSFEQALYSLEYFGNTSAASIRLPWIPYPRSKVVNGQQILPYGFGAGLTMPVNGEAGYCPEVSPHLQPKNTPKTRKTVP